MNYQIIIIIITIIITIITTLIALYNYVYRLGPLGELRRDQEPGLRDLLRSLRVILLIVCNA